MNVKNLKMIAAIALTFAAGILVIRADTHYVRTPETCTNTVLQSPYTNWADAATNIQWAVDAAEAATLDTVLVSNGTYNLTNQIEITTAITVKSFYGTNAINTSSIINGNYPAYTNRCVSMTAGTLDGFIISNGYHVETGSTGGGGVRLVGSGVSVLNSLICYNVVTGGAYVGGGGIYIRREGGMVSNCTIVSNTAFVSGANAGGGGVKLDVNAPPKIFASRISGNISSNIGGGIFQAGGIVSNCTVDNNTSAGAGGGIFTQGTVANCVISNNVAVDRGGGIYFETGNGGINLTIIGNRADDSTGTGEGGGGAYIYGGAMSNCVVTANRATNSAGGGVYMVTWGDYVQRIANCTIAGNVAKTGGGGLAAIYGGGGLYTFFAQNCLIYGNTNLEVKGGGVYLDRTGPYPYGLINCTIAGNEAGTLGGGLYTTQTNNYIANCIIYGNVTTNDAFDEVYNATVGVTNNYWYNCAPTNLVLGQGNITNNPLFIDTVNGNYRLSSARSPCVNTGTNQAWMTNAVDLDGRTRLRYGAVDMGAYEFIHKGTIFRIR